MADPFKRARDSDRDAAIEVVEAAYAEGRLSSADRDLRVERLLKAETLGEVEGYVRDLQGRPAAAAPAAAPGPDLTLDRPKEALATLRPQAVRQRQNRGCGLAIVLTLVGLGLAAAVGGVVLAVVGSVSSFTEESVRTPEKPDMFTTAELDEFLAAVEKRAGASKVVSLGIYEEYAYAQIPVGRRNNTWLYEWHYWRGEELDSTSTRSTTTDPLIDLRDLDPQVVIDLYEQSTQLVPDPTMRYVLVSNGGALDGNRLVLSAYATDDFGTGYLAATADGQVFRKVEPAS